MSTFVSVVASTFWLVFVAELGDKTQLLAVGFGAQYRMRTVFTGLVIGFGVAGALAAVVGGVLGSALPDRPIRLIGGVLFLGFAIWTLLDRDDDGVGDADDDATRPETPPRGGRSLVARSAVLMIATSIALGELGDKTQLTTATLAAQANPFAVWLGATAGEVSSAMIGAVLGNRFATAIKPSILRYASAVLFAVFGVAMIAAAI